jgi:Mitochondrial carrier protein
MRTQTHVSVTRVAGASAGVTEALINCPFELVKVRMQALENQKLYRGTAHAVTTILRSEGVAVLYRGVEPMYVGWFFLLPLVSDCS